MAKTDFEITSDAIKYCRARLGEMYMLIDRYENNEFKKKPSIHTYRQFKFEAAVLEHILGIREEKPQWRNFM